MLVSSAMIAKVGAAASDIQSPAPNPGQARRSSLRFIAGKLRKLIKD